MFKLDRFLDHGNSEIDIFCVSPHGTISVVKPPLGGLLKAR